MFWSRFNSFRISSKCMYNWYCHVAEISELWSVLLTWWKNSACFVFMEPALCFVFFVITSAYSNLQRDCQTSWTFSHILIWPFFFLICSECITKGEISVWTGLARAIVTRQKVKTGRINRLARQKQDLRQWPASVGWWKLCLCTTYSHCFKCSF